MGTQLERQLIPRFDYESVSPSAAKFLKGQADRIRRQCVTSIIQIGKALLEAKHHLSHGAFLRWVEGEAGVPVRTAQAYMRVALWASDKGATVAHLLPSALYLLSASTTPEHFANEMLSRAESGECIMPSLMREQLKALRETSRRPAREDRATGELSLDGEPNIVIEFVGILVQGLSTADVVRIREIVARDDVQHDRHLARRLKRAFELCVANSNKIEPLRRGRTRAANQKRRSVNGHAAAGSSIA